MAALFRRPKIVQPKIEMPEPLPPPPERSDKETEALAIEQRKKYGRGGGAFSLLTGGMGGGAVSTASRYLGAAART